MTTAMRPPLTARQPHLQPQVAGVTGTARVPRVEPPSDLQPLKAGGEGGGQTRTHGRTAQVTATGAPGGRRGLPPLVWATKRPQTRVAKRKPRPLELWQSGTH